MSQPNENVKSKMASLRLELVVTFFNKPHQHSL